MFLFYSSGAADDASSPYMMNFTYSFGSSSRNSTNSYISLSYASRCTIFLSNMFVRPVSRMARIWSRIFEVNLLTSFRLAVYAASLFPCGRPHTLHQPGGVLHLQVQDLCDGVAQIWLSTPFFIASTPAILGFHGIMPSQPCFSNPV